MLLTVLFSTLYLAVAVFGAFMTYVEHRDTADSHIGGAVLGLVACALWPLTVLTVAVAAASTLSGA